MHIDTPQLARNWVIKITHDAWWQHECGIIMADIARIIGQHANEFNKFVNGHRELKATAERVMALKGMMERRESVFVSGHGLKTCLPAPPIKPTQPLLARNLINGHDEWSLNATCVQCGKNQYLPIMMNDNFYAACYHCLPPLQHKSMGAVLQDGSLLLYALEEMGILGDIKQSDPEIAAKPKVKRPFKKVKWKADWRIAWQRKHSCRDGYWNKRFST